MLAAPHEPPVPTAAHPVEVVTSRERAVKIEVDVNLRTPAAFRKALSTLTVGG
jgi:hypothetical protein